MAQLLKIEQSVPQPDNDFFFAIALINIFNNEGLGLVVCQAQRAVIIGQDVVEEEL